MALFAAGLVLVAAAPAAFGAPTKTSETGLLQAVTGRDGQARTIVAEWLASSEHRANLLRRGFTRIGFGIVRGSFLGSAGSTVVTADFAG